MPTLPTPGGDRDTWGDELNELLEVALNDDGTLKGGLTEVELVSASSVGATTISVHVPPEARLARFLVAIGAYTSACELRMVTAVTGATLTVTALENAHSAGDRVVFLDGVSANPGLWGCVGNGITDDHTGLQAAIRQTTTMGIWLDGQNRSCAIGQPFMLPQSHKLRNLTIKALASFTPAETTNAMGMGYNGSVRTFTANAATDVLTCSSAHGAPADNQGVVLQGSDLPAPLVTGKFYYIRDRSGADFKVALTSGGAAVDITSAGSGGTAYFEVYAANMKTYMEDTYWNGNNVVGLNGILVSVQQQGYWDKVRVDHCPGFGVKMKGQQHVIYNLELIHNTDSFVLDGMSFLWVYGFNAEQCDRAIILGTGGGNASFFGVHVEMTNGSGYSDTGSIAFDIDNPGGLILYDAVVSMNASGQTVLKCDTGSSATSSYTCYGLGVSGGISSAGLIMVNDVDRNISLDSWDDCKRRITFISATQNTSSGSFADPFTYVIARPGGGTFSYGAQNITMPSLRITPGSTQTGDQLRAEDTSGNRVSGFNKAGVFFTERNSAPADSDLVAGELAVWFDDTNGAAKVKFKAKEAGGTVRTGEVALA